MKHWLGLCDTRTSHGMINFTLASSTSYLATSALNHFILLLMWFPGILIIGMKFTIICNLTTFDSNGQGRHCDVDLLRG